MFFFWVFGFGFLRFRGPRASEVRVLGLFVFGVPGLMISGASLLRHVDDRSVLLKDCGRRVCAFRLADGMYLFAFSNLCVDVAHRSCLLFGFVTSLVYALVVVLAAMCAWWVIIHQAYVKQAEQ